MKEKYDVEQEWSRTHSFSVPLLIVVSRNRLLSC